MTIYKLAVNWREVHLVVLTYNGMDVTKTFINRLFEHTNMDLLSLTFIDNGSIDGTVELLKDLSEKEDNVSLILNNDNKGVIGGRNQGFEFFLNDSTSPKLMFLDNDQYVKKGWLEHHLSVMNEGYDMIGIEAWQLNDVNIPVQKNSKINQWFSYVGCGGTLVTREVVEKIGFFDERYNPAYYEDPDYSYRVLKEGFKIGWNICARVDHLGHGTLGRMGDRKNFYVKSYNAFCEKWKKGKPQTQRQRPLSMFDCIRK